MDPIRKVRKSSLVGLALFLSFGSYASAQKCVLKVGAWEGFPEEKYADGGRGISRKDTVTGFSSTATNQKSRRLYEGVYLLGSAYFENIPEGEYKITVRKTGFKRTIQDVKFSCDYARGGFYFEDILVFRGNPKETVALKKPMRLDRVTRLGSNDGEASDPTLLRKTISGGVLNGNAISLPKPAYPPTARAVRAGGTVDVQVLIDESGYVVSAKAIGGSYTDPATMEQKTGMHPLLISTSESAALKAKFSPTLVDGKPVRVSGIITYKFVP